LQENLMEKNFGAGMARLKIVRINTDFINIFVLRKRMILWVIQSVARLSFLS